MSEFNQISEKNPEIAEPGKDVVDNIGGKEGEITEPLKQSAEDNAKYAAARRRAEAERDAVLNKMNSYAESRGFKSFDELEKATKQQDQDEIFSKFEEETGLPAETFKPVLEAMMKNNPDVIEARRLVNESKMAESKRAFDEQIAAIGKINSEIKSFDDLLKMPTFGEFDEMVRVKGYSMVDAYKLANIDTIGLDNANVARANVLNNINSKAHLMGNQGGGGALAVVPPDVVAMYREFNPGISDEEISKDYNNSLKRDK